MSLQQLLSQGRFIGAWNLIPDHSEESLIRYVKGIVPDDVYQQKMLTLQLQHPQHGIRAYIGYHSDPQRFIGLDGQKYKHHEWGQAVCNYYDLWQTIVEEAINVFESPHLSWKFNMNDAYQIIKTCSRGGMFVKLPTATIQYLVSLTTQIETSIEIRSQILTQRHQYRHNVETIGRLLCQWLRHESLPDPILMSYYHNLECAFDLDSDLAPILLDQFRRSGQPIESSFGHHQMGFVRTSIVLYHHYMKHEILTTPELETICVVHIDRDECRCLLSLMVCQGLSHYYDDPTACLHLKNFWEHPRRSLHDPARVRLWIDPDKILFWLVKLHVEKRVHLLNDIDLSQLIKDQSGSEFIKLKELMYQQGRSPNYQKLTIANNTEQTIVIQTIIQRQKEEYLLQPHQRRVYTDLRDRGIYHIDLCLCDEARQPIVHRPYVDINAYVAWYGQNKFTIYYEPDEMLENQQPTSAMIQEVAKCLSKHYQTTKTEYPSITYEDFIKGLGCETIGEDRNHTLFGMELNSYMRPRQIMEALKIILGVD